MMKVFLFITLLFTFTLMIPVGASSQDELLAHWSLDESYGNTIYEYIRGLSNGLLLSNDEPEWLPMAGIINGALTLNQHTSGIRIQCEDTESFDLTRYYTLSAWVRQDEGNRGWIILRTSRGSDLRRYYGIFSDGLNNKIEFHYVRHTVAQNLTWNTPDIAGDGKWHSIVLVVGVGKADLFVDRQCLGTEYISVTSSGWNGTDPTPEILIGMRNGSGAEDESFKGSLDDIRIYNTVDAGLPFDKIYSDFTFAGGSGTEHQPFRVFSRRHLEEIRDNELLSESHFLMMNDIDMCEESGTENCSEGVIINDFSGTFDGNGYSIKNFRHMSIDKNDVGLFGTLFHGAVRNLTMEDPLIHSTDGSNIGSLAGTMHESSIYRCTVRGGTVSGSTCVGGLVGNVQGGRIDESIASTETNGVSSVGGLVGTAERGTIRNCYSEGSVIGSEYVGGAVGYCETPVRFCYSKAAVEGQDNTGGLFGHAEPMAVTSSYWDFDASNQETSAGGYGRTSAEMSTRETYVGWSCEDLWKLSAGDDYPRLAWEPGDGESMTLLDYFEGDGTESDPYRIYTPHDLNIIGAIPCLRNKDFILMNNIDMTGYNGRDGNPYYEMIEDYSGTFDGNHFSISNLIIDSDNVHIIGMIRKLSYNSEIRDLTLIDPMISAGSAMWAGSLAGMVQSGRILRCGVEGGEVNGNEYVGGLVGSFINGLISSCYSKADVNAESRAGGLVGQNTRFGYIADCYSEGDVSAVRRVGGLVGSNHCGIYFCYSTGLVQGEEDTGGLVGYGSPDHVSASFWDTESSTLETSAGGFGRTTSEMLDADTYTGWMCSEEWKIDDGNDTPRLVWEESSGAPFSGQVDLTGTGTEDDPYIIRNEDEMNTIGLYSCIWNKCFVLETDLDMSGYDGVDGRPFYNWIGNLLTPFSGVFDGSGKSISNLSSSNGLFGVVEGPDARISNLILVDPEIICESISPTGGIVSLMNRGYIGACNVTGGNISGRSKVGGLAGSTSNCLIEHCFTTCAVVSPEMRAGGLVGQNSGEISECYSESPVGGRGEIGGLVGTNFWQGEISDCYSTGPVTSVLTGGGLVGISYGTVHCCYSNGAVSTGYQNGGLIGVNLAPSKCTASFWDIDLSGQTSSDGGKGLHTAEMMDMDRYISAGWDFTTPVWGIDHGNSYPWLIYWNPDPGLPGAPGKPGRMQPLN